MGITQVDWKKVYSIDSLEKASSTKNYEFV